MKVFESDNVQFHYTEPAPLNQRLLLLTKHNTYEIGPWKGAFLPYNKTYKAWAPLPLRHLGTEQRLGYQ